MGVQIGWQEGESEVDKGDVPAVDWFPNLIGFLNCCGNSSLLSL